MFLLMSHLISCQDLEPLVLHWRPLLAGVALGHLHRGTRARGGRHLPAADAPHVAPPGGLRELLLARLAHVDLLRGALALGPKRPRALRGNLGGRGILEALLPVERGAARFKGLWSRSSARYLLFLLLQPYFPDPCLPSSSISAVNRGMPSRGEDRWL